MKSCVVFAFMVLSCTISCSSSQICKQLDSDKFKSCVAANFTHTIDSLTTDYYVQNYSKIIDHLSEKLKRCSPHVDIMLCSLYVPKCVKGQFKPFLPCRRVCQEFVYGCRERLLTQGLSGLVSLCPVLLDETSESGKCFEPEDFKPKHVKGRLLYETENPLLFTS